VIALSNGASTVNFSFSAINLPVSTAPSNPTEEGIARRAKNITIDRMNMCPHPSPLPEGEGIYRVDLFCCYIIKPRGKIEIRIGQWEAYIIGGKYERQGYNLHS
jgi:hypothetical protein